LPPEKNVAMWQICSVVNRVGLLCVGSERWDQTSHQRLWGVAGCAWLDVQRSRTATTCPGDWYWWSGDL